MIEHLFINMKNSVWEIKKLDSSSIGDGWVHNYFKYPNRDIHREPYPEEILMCKAMQLPDYEQPVFIDEIQALGIKDFIALEVFDCDSWSRRSDVILELFINVGYFEEFIKPKLIERPEIDYREVLGLNSEDRMIMLGDSPIKQSELTRYWEIIGADTKEKKMWNTPTIEVLKKALDEDGFELKNTEFRPPSHLHFRKLADLN